MINSKQSLLNFNLQFFFLLISNHKKKRKTFHTRYKSLSEKLKKKEEKSFNLLKANKRCEDFIFFTFYVYSSVTYDMFFFISISFLSSSLIFNFHLGCVYQLKIKMRKKYEKEMVFI